jgi:hypothetical protein
VQQQSAVQATVGESCLFAPQIGSIAANGRRAGGNKSGDIILASSQKGKSQFREIGPGKGVPAPQTVVTFQSAYSDSIPDLRLLISVLRLTAAHGAAKANSCLPRERRQEH